MKIYESVDALRAAVGQHAGYSDWHEITQEQINLFAQATGDHQWIHVDPERAAKGPFGTTIAHGYLTLSLIPMLAGQVSRVDGVAMVVNYGCNRVRFPSPVPVGAKVRAGVELTDVEDVQGGVQATMKVTYEVEGAPKPACVAELLIRYYG